LVRAKIVLPGTEAASRVVGENKHEDEAKAASASAGMFRKECPKSEAGTA
jgi:hypothetical protein